MISFVQKLTYEPNRTIKAPLKLFVMGFFIIFGLLFVNSHNFVEASYLSEYFETYDVGQDILALENWWTGTEAPADYMEIISNPVYSGSRGTIFNKNLLAPNHVIGYDFFNGEPISEGSLSVAFRTNGTSGSVDGMYFHLGDVGGTIGYLGFGYSLGSFGEIRYKSGLNWYLLGNYTGNNWFVISIEWKVVDGVSATIRYKLNSGSWTDWVDTQVSTKVSPTYIKFTYVRWLNQKYWYIDDISIQMSCSPTQCEACNHWFDCEVVGCCWYYNPYFIDFNYCATCYPYEECSYEFCGSCQNQEECEAEGCYWTGEYCSWIVSECGDELACQFCETKEECETEGCYWNLYSETCWYEAPTLPWQTWLDYYELHGGYDDPLAFVNNLALTFEDSFETISGILSGFAIHFNTSDALVRGTGLGSVIPKARGYLKVFDRFLGHIPIGETFVFILIFILAVGLLRIIFRIK